MKMRSLASFTQFTKEDLPPSYEVHLGAPGLVVVKVSKALKRRVRKTYLPFLLFRKVCVRRILGPVSTMILQDLHDHTLGPPIVAMGAVWRVDRGRLGGGWREEDWREGGRGWRSLYRAHLRSLFKPLAFSQRAGSLHSVDYAFCLVYNTKRMGTHRHGLYTIRPLTGSLIFKLLRFCTHRYRLHTAWMVASAIRLLDDKGDKNVYQIDLLIRILFRSRQLGRDQLPRPVLSLKQALL